MNDTLDCLLLPKLLSSSVLWCSYKGMLGVNMALPQCGTTYLYGCDTQFWSVIRPCETCTVTSFDTHAIRGYSCLGVMVLTLTEIHVDAHNLLPLHVKARRVQSLRIISS